MQNAEMMDAILDGQGDGLAAAYDRYAPALYAYCRSLLGEPASAGDAVQDTFIVAAGAWAGSVSLAGSGPGSMPWPATNAAAVFVPAHCLSRPAPRANRPTTRPTWARAPSRRNCARSWARRSPGWTPVTGRSSS